MAALLRRDPAPGPCCRESIEHCRRSALLAASPQRLTPVDDPFPAAIDRVPPPRREILLALKRAGELSIPELATTIGLSHSATRQQIAILEDEGSIESRAQRGKVGRPVLRYRVSTLGNSLFPHSYGHLLLRLFEAMDLSAPGSVEAALGLMFARMSSERRREFAELTLAQRLAATEEIHYNFLISTTSPAPGIYELTMNHCPFWEFATRSSALCNAECKYLCDALAPAGVERTRFRRDGDAVCAYTVRSSDVSN